MNKVIATKQLEFLKSHNFLSVCPLNIMPNRSYTSCWQCGIGYFQKVTKDQFPEWSV